MTEHGIESARIPGGWTTREISLGRHNFRVTLPAAPDDFLDDPDVQAANRNTGYMPYWSYLWPTSLELASAVLAEDWPLGAPALEIGAGIGLTGLAGLASGLRVTFSDYDPLAVELAVHNARNNGWPDAEGLVLDWRTPIARQFPVIFGCDVIYEKQNHAPILDLLQVMLTDEGSCWIGDPGRHQADEFVNGARQRGFELELRELPRLEFPGRPDGFTNLWILSRPA